MAERHFGRHVIDEVEIHERGMAVVAPASAVAGHVAVFGDHPDEITDSGFPPSDILPPSSGPNKVLFDDGTTQAWSDSPILKALRLGGSDDIGAVSTIIHDQLNTPNYTALGVRGIAADAAGSVFAQAGNFEVQIPDGLTHDIASLISLYTQIVANVPEGRTISGAHGLQSNVENAGPGTISTLRGFFSQIDNYGGGHVNKAEVIAGYLYDYTGGSTYGSAAIFAGYFDGEVDDSITTGYGIWLQDMSNASITNGYAFWYDSPGVFRIKKDGVMAYYNPAHTKYTPGATDFERIVQQWNTSVAEYGVQAGTTGGTLRSLRLLAGTGLSVENGSGTHVPVTASQFNGPIVLPTSDPHIAGALYLVGTTPTVSAG